MSMCYLRLRLILAIIFTMSACVSAMQMQNGKHDLAQLSRPPLDSIQARDTRIWFGLQHQGTCRVRVEIFDTAQKVIKLLADSRMISGYYNMYWGKKDDSGQWVPKGLYSYKVISSCLPEKKGKLWAGYKPFEKVVQLLVDTADIEAAVTVRVDTSMARINLHISTLYGVLVDSLCSDTVLTSGTHRFVWKPKAGTARGEYWVRMKVESFVVEERLKLP